MDMDGSIREEFVSDSNDALDEIEDDLLELEKGKGNSAELIDNVFRAFHSIKGCSAFMGLTNLSDLTHSAEDVLSFMRTSEIQVEPRFIDPLFLVVDAIRTMLDDLERSNGMDISPLMNQLTNQLETLSCEKAAAEGQGKQVGSIFLSDLLKVFPDFDKRLFESNTLPGTNAALYLLQYDLDEKGESLVPLFRKMRNSGTIIKGKVYFPPSSLQPGCTVPYNVIFATALDPGTLETELGLSKKQIFLIETHPAQT